MLDHLVIQQLLGSLEERERQLLKLRYFENKTQTEVAKMMGMTQVQVSRMEKKTLYRLRESMQ